MLDIGWSELLLIGVVALIVVGPKDLPVMFRSLGRITAKARRMAREFSNAMEDAARESGVKDVADDLKAATSKRSLGIDALERATEKFEQWDPKLPTADKTGATLQPDPGAQKAALDEAETAFEPDADAPVEDAAKVAQAAPSDAAATAVPPAAKQDAKPATKKDEA